MKQAECLLYNKMERLKLKFFLALILLYFNHAEAQTIYRDNIALVKKIKPITTELSAGFRLNTDGWSIFVDKGYNRYENSKTSDMFYNVFLLQAELGEKKGPKEIKYNNTQNTNPSITDRTRPYVYGKINNFYQFKIGAGFRRLIAGKPEVSTVSIHWVYLGGFTLGMEKPYYIDAYVPQDNGGPLVRKSITYNNDSDKVSFLTQPNIIGASPFSQGLSEMKFVPGVHAKTALHFDFARRRQLKLAIETGINAELYTQAIQLMANQTAVPYSVNVYASIQFGKRW